MAAGLEITDRGSPPTSPPFVENVVTAVLEHVERTDLEVSLLLTDDAEIAAVHGRFLEDDTPTDVISFPMDDGVEIIVSVETAGRVAERMGHDPLAEIALYITHGILHACGFDDIEADDRRRMRDAERAVLQRLGLRVTAVDE